MSRNSGVKEKKKPNVLRVSLWLCLMVALVAAAGLVYYFAGATPSLYEKIVIYVLLAGAALVVVRLAVWGFGWTKKERVSELGLHIVRFAVILAAVTVCVFAMMTSDYNTQYRQSAGNELRQQALASRIQLQDMLGEELGTDEAYYRRLYASLPGLLDKSETNSGRHINLYLFVTPERQPAGTPFDDMEENSGIFAASTNTRLGVTASAGYIDRVYREGELTFSEYSRGESSFMSAFVPVFTTAGRPVGVMELCEPGSGIASLFGETVIELLLRVAALVSLFAFGFYGVMQLIDIVMRPRKVDRSCRVLSCGREAARPVLFFVALCAGLPVMLLAHAEEMRGLVTVAGLPSWLNGVMSLLPVCLYLLCFLVGWLMVRKTRERLTEAPSNISLIAATACALALMLIKDTGLFEKVAIMNQWYIPLALIAVCGLCYGVSYRTIAKYQAQSDALFGKDKYAYLCTALGAITGTVLGAWLLDASGEAGVKVAMLILNAGACAISIILLEDLNQTVSVTDRTDSRIASLGGLMLPLIPVGFACGYVWVYITDYLGGSGYSVTARSIITAAPVIVFCIGNRLALGSSKSQRSALCVGGVIAGLVYLPMVWTAAPVMAVVSCGLLCLASLFVSAGVYSSLRHNERGGAFVAFLVSALVGALGSSMLSGFFAGRLCMLVMAGVSVVLALLFLATKFPNRIPGPELHDAIAGDVNPAPYIPPEPSYDSFAPLPMFSDEPEMSVAPDEPELLPPSEEAPAEPETPAEESSVDWDAVDYRTADVMSEFMASEEPAEDSASEPEAAPSAFADDDPLPIVFPDADDGDSGYNPDGGAISKSNESLGTDEGFIDFGL